MTQMNSAEQIFLENEREANRYASRCLLVLAIIAVFSWVLNLVGIFQVPPKAMNVGMPICILLFLVPIFICKRAEGTEQWLKYLLLGGCVAGITVIAIAMPKHAVLAWVAPVLMSCHYYSRRLTTNILVISVICLWIAIILCMFVGEGDPNLLGGKKIAEAVITPQVFKETIIFFAIPRSAILIGLSSVVITVDKRTRRLLERQAKDTAERQRIETELNIASAIQLSMLPGRFPAFPDRRDFDIYALMDPAKEVGGDFYDFYLLTEDTLGILIADVSGKGVPGAMSMMQAKTLISSLANSGLGVEEIFTRANDTLCENNEANMFITAWMGILNLKTGMLDYVNAGHNPPLLRRKDGRFEYLKSPAGFVLAGWEGFQYRRQQMQLNPGDELFLYTDGITEATDLQEQLYGEERLAVALNGGIGCDSETLCKKIKQDVEAFVGAAPQFDDITMLSLVYKGGTEHV